MKYVIQSIAILLVLLLASSCSISRKATAASATVAKQDSTLVASEIIEHVQQNEPQFKTVDISKFDLDIQFGQASYTMRGSLRMIRDSIISLSVQPMLGIEVARIDLYTDYFCVYDKMNHRFSETSYDDIQIATGIPFDFAYIQSMLSAQFYSITNYDSRTFSVADNTDSSYVFVGHENLNGLYQYYEAYFGSFNIAASGFQRGHSQALPFAVFYSDWRTVRRKYHFPFKVRIEVDHKKFYFQANTSIDQIEFDGEINITKINRERYKRVAFSTYFAEQEI